MNYYNLLNVPHDATLKEINTSFKNLSQRFHPDKNPNDKYSEEKMKLITQAYEVLSDYDKRIIYDNQNSTNNTTPSTNTIENYKLIMENHVKLLEFKDKIKEKHTFF